MQQVLLCACIFGSEVNEHLVDEDRFGEMLRPIELNVGPDDRSTH